MMDEVADLNPSTDRVTDFDHFARFYDADYRNYDDDVGLILGLAELASGPILELGCGTGRLMMPAAAAGHRITGVDNSPALLQLARRKLSDQKLLEQATLVEADLGTFALNAGFAFAFYTSNTLMHLTTQHAQLQALQNTCRHLAPGGKLFIDLFNPDVENLVEIDGVRELADEWIDPESGRRVLKWCTRTVDWANQIQQTTFVYEEVENDGTSTETVCTFPLRFLWRAEALLLLEKAGFHDPSVWGDFDQSQYSSNSPRLILLAKR